MLWNDLECFGMFQNDIHWLRSSPVRSSPGPRNEIQLTAEYVPDVPSFLISSAPGVARVTKSIRSARFLRMFRLIRDLIQW